MDGKTLKERASAIHIGVLFLLYLYLEVFKIYYPIVTYTEQRTAPKLLYLLKNIY
jgi:hypothetical protein